MHGLNVLRGVPTAVVLALVLGGCSGFGTSKPPPPPTDPNVFPANYKSQIANLLRTYLSNPTKVRDAYISAPELKPFGGAVHYVSCLRFNPRDSTNRYTGTEERVAEFLGGRLNQFLPANPELCANAAYQRFPEAEAIVP